MSSSFKKLVASLVLVTQLVYPLVASASVYVQKMAVKDLRVTSGAEPSVINIDPNNTSSTTAVAGAATLLAAPSSINFGTTTTGVPTSAQTITLSNVGSAPAVLGSLSASSQFGVTNNCNGATLPVLGACRINVVFSPTQMAPGGIVGSVFVPFTANGVSATALLGLHGIAGAPDPAHTPAATLEGFGGSDPSMALNAQGKPQISFADALISSGTYSKTFVLRSDGTSPISFNGLTLTGNDGSYSATTTCPALIPSGDGCTVTVTFAPVSPGQKTATLTVKTSAAAGNDLIVALAGAATSSSTFSLSTGAVSFGAVPLNQVQSLNASILNTGTTALTTPAIAIAGAFFSTSSNCPSTLATGASCLATVTFAPTSIANAAGTLSVSFAETGTQTATVTGTGSGPWLTVDAISKSFGTVGVGSSSTLTYTVTNDGNAVAPLTMGAAPVDVTRTTDCGATLAVAAVCHISVQYLPGSQGSISGTTTIASTWNTLSLSYAGTSVWQSVFGLSAGTLSFGDTLVNQSTTLAVQVTNPGGVALGEPVISTTGAEFTPVHNCGTTLSPGSSCTVNVTMSPVLRGTLVGTLSVQYPNTPLQTVALGGRGVAPVLSANFVNQDFGSVVVGQSQVLTYVLSNLGDAATGPLTITGLPSTVTVSSTCGTSLAVNATCAITLTYSPLATESLTGSAVVAGAGSSVTLSFHGVSAPAHEFAFSTSGLNFGSVEVGTSTSQSVSVFNTGISALTTPVVSTASASFTASHNCGATLSPGSSCDVTVTFAPVTALSKSGTLTVAFAEGVSHSATLAGVGTGDLLQVSPTVQTFGNTLPGSSESRTFVLSNTGNAATGLSYSSLTAGVTRAGTCGATLAASSTCTVVLTYTPTDTLGVTGTFTVTGTKSSSGLSFSGTSQTANAVLTSNDGNTAFGTTQVGSTATKTFTLQNVGQRTASNVYVALAGGSLSFTANTCGIVTDMVNLSAGSSCSVSVQFAPGSVLTLSGASLTASGSFDNGGQALTLSGAGAAANLAMTSSDSTYAFGSVSVNSSASKTITITNSGNAPATGMYLTLTGTGLSLSANTCGVSGARVAIAGGATCSAVVTYTPTATGTLSSAAIVATGVYTNGTSITNTITGTATGSIGAMTAAGGTYDFTSVIQNSSASKAITITNSGNAPATGVYASVTGTDVTISTNTCGTIGTPVTLAASATCSFYVVYTPTVVGTLTNGNVSVHGSFMNGTLSNTLLGSSTAATTYATWDPTSLPSNVWGQLTNSNLTYSVGGTSSQYVEGTLAKSTGKWYWEYTINATGPQVLGVSNTLVSKAVITSDLTKNWGGGSAVKAFYGIYATNFGGGVGPGSFGNALGYTTSGATTGYTNAAGTVYGVALNADAGTITFYNNCTQKTVVSGLVNGPWKPTIGSGGNSAVPNITANFGKTGFACSVPSGYNAGLY
jgi:hypothetical protein